MTAHSYYCTCGDDLDDACPEHGEDGRHGAACLVALTRRRYDDMCGDCYYELCEGER